MIEPGRHPDGCALQRFADHESAGDEHSLIKAHISECDTCRTAVEQSRRVMQMTHNLRTPLPRPDLLGQVLAARGAGGRVLLPVSKETGALVVTRSLKARQMLTALAAVALFAVGVITIRNNQQNRVPAGSPTHDLFLSSVILPAVVHAQEAPSKSIDKVDGSRVHAGEYEYELSIEVARGTAKPERSTIRIEPAVHNGALAWRAVGEWHGHAQDLPETTFVARYDLQPLARVARNVGQSHYTVQQAYRAVAGGDSLVGTMQSVAHGVSKIARFITSDKRPLIAGQAGVLMLLQGVALQRNWSGRAAVAGWGSVQNDLTYPLDIRVIGETRTETPAGSFDCWIVRTNGGAGKLGRLAGEARLLVRKSDNLIVQMTDASEPGIKRQSVLLSEVKR